MNGIVEIPNFLSKTECQHYMDIIDMCLDKPDVMREQLYEGRVKLPDLAKKITLNVKETVLCDNTFYFNRMKNKSKMGVHLDKAEDIYNATFLIYLNESENWIGGETQFFNDYLGREIDYSLKPKEGTAVVFDIGIPHAVSQVEYASNTNSRRYTIITDVRIKRSILLRNKKLNSLLNTDR